LTFFLYICQGGLILYPVDQLDAVKEAFSRFQEVDDTKAAIMITFDYSQGQLTTILFSFYDAPTPPPGLFDEFLAIPAIQNTVSTTSYSDFILSMDSGSGVNTRTYYKGVPAVRYSPAIFDAFKNQTVFWGTQLAALDPNANVINTMEPFASTLLSHGTPSAYPPDRCHVFLPSNLGVTWTDASLDATMASALRQTAEVLRDAMLADGQDLSHASVYVNYALFDTPLEDIYGKNVLRLCKIKAEIDPEDVMGLAGGFKF